jgi:hypothetical protein
MNRVERRRQDRDDRSRLARGLDAGRADGNEVAALMRVLHGLLDEAKEGSSVAPLIDYLHANMRAGERHGPRERLDCKRGCAFCCHAYVSARAPELLFMKRAIPGRDREVVRAAIDAAFAVTGEMGPGARTRIFHPCPMLEDGACRAYAARPMTCRMAVSESAAACRVAFSPNAGAVQIPIPEFYPTLRRGYSLALAGALRRAGLPAWSYEYNSAMRLALARPDAEAAWLAGEDVFAGAVQDPGSDPFVLPSNLRLYELAFG